jgi:hypothetical protein
MRSGRTGGHARMSFPPHPSFPFQHILKSSKFGNQGRALRTGGFFNGLDPPNRLFFSPADHATPPVAK